MSESAAVIAPLVDDVVRLARRRLPVRRVLLIGSAARGEETYGTLDGRTELFSDLEFVVTTTRPPTSAERRAFSRETDALARTVGFENPLFHYDVTVTSELVFWPKLALDSHLRRHELAANARVVHGPDFDRERYLLTADTVDRGATNELVLRRLWAQLLALPPDVARSPEVERPELLALSLCRNSLDVLTIYLIDCGVLLPTYRARLAHLEAHPELAEPLGPDALPAQRAALSGKLTLALPESVTTYYDALLSQYLRLLAHLVGHQTKGLSLEPESIASVVQKTGERERDVFRGSPLTLARQVRREARIVRRYARDLGAGSAFGWLATPRRAMMIGVLFELHHGIASMLRGEPLGRLDASIEHLTRLDPALRNHHWPSEGSARWESVRDQLVHFMRQWKYNDPSALDVSGFGTAARPART